MTVSTKQPKWAPQVLSDLKRHEGFRRFAYPDPLSKLGQKYRGKKYGWGYRPATEILAEFKLKESDGLPWTVGYGFTGGVTPRTSITLAYANLKLETVMYEHTKHLEALLPGWETKHPLFVQTVFANMIYNMGHVKLAKFAPTLAVVQAGRYAEAGTRLTKSAWYKQTSSRAVELVNRLKKGEIEMEHRV